MVSRASLKPTLTSSVGFLPMSSRRAPGIPYPRSSSNAPQRNSPALGPRGREGIVGQWPGANRDDGCHFPLTPFSNRYGSFVKDFLHRIVEGCSNFSGCHALCLALRQPRPPHEKAGTNSAQVRRNNLGTNIPVDASVRKPDTKCSF